LVGWPLGLPASVGPAAHSGSEHNNSSGLDLGATWLDRPLRTGASGEDALDIFEPAEWGDESAGGPTLVGMSYRPGGVSIAFFRDADGVVRLIKPGGHVGAFWLVSVGRDHVVVDTDGGRMQLQLANADEWLDAMDSGDPMPLEFAEFDGESEPETGG